MVVRFAEERHSKFNLVEDAGEASVDAADEDEVAGFQPREGGVHRRKTASHYETLKYISQASLTVYFITL